MCSLRARPPDVVACRHTFSSHDVHHRARGDGWCATPSPPRRRFRLVERLPPHGERTGERRHRGRGRRRRDGRPSSRASADGGRREGDGRTRRRQGRSRKKCRTPGQPATEPEEVGADEAQNYDCLLANWIVDAVRLLASPLPSSLQPSHARVRLPGPYDRRRRNFPVSLWLGLLREIALRDARTFRRVRAYSRTVLARGAVSTEARDRGRSSPSNF
mmetsp:Transcript_38806/g.124390  ORF Transcript_38806/g.124390 Transcript_38806/m.124390 type:complete len:217 (+) Transcript_38806:2297-2947(+)